MYYSQLLMLDDILSKDELIKLQNYLASLTPSTSKLITVSKIKNEVRISDKLAAITLMRCVDLGILKISYGIRCPECGILLKKISESHYEEDINCYKCDDFTFRPSEDEIVVFFELIVDIPSFNKGQHEEITGITTELIQVAPCDTLAALKEFCEVTVDSIKKKAEQENRAAEKNRKLKRIQFKTESLEKDIKDLSEHKRNKNRKIAVTIQVLLFVFYTYVIYNIFKNVDDSKLSCSLSVASSIFVFVADKLINGFLCTDINIIKSNVTMKYKDILDGLNEERKAIELG